MGKTDLWDRLKTTDPKHTSKFKRAGGFSGTAIKPIWSIHRMTEEFGPCGVGWGVNEPTFQIVHGNDEALVYCTVSVWHGSRENIVFGVGGDKAVGRNRNGAFTDDEAFKKAFTDAVTNAFKFIGVSADVHMGMFDDSKYVSELKEEFAEPKRDNPHVNRVEDFFDEISTDIPDTPPGMKMLVKEARPEYAVLVKEMCRIQDPNELKEWGKAKAKIINSFPNQWPQMFRGEYTEHLKSISNGKAA
jgi:hypothetical protein